MRLHVHADAEAAARAVAEEIAAASAAAGERFAIALAGGSTPQAAYALLAQGPLGERIDWRRWHVFFGDERQVPLDDPRSNYRNAREALLDRVPIPSGQIHPFTSADTYEGLLRAFFGERPDFDLLLLGMGDDGHTASLFPGSIALLEEERWAIEPPDVVGGMARLTLTLPALNAARRRLFLVSGAAKADALERVRSGGDVPAAQVRDADWHVDRAALGQPA
jgi:6-phosphogluconolactonase